MNDVPRKRGRPPKIMAAPVDRLAALTDREKRLASKQRARYRYTFDMPLELYEALLDQAESWDQPFPDVVRACLRKGLDHIKQFGSRDYNPFVTGRLTPVTQHDIDPTGLAWPPTAPPPQAWEAPWTPPPQPIREAPPPMQWRPPTLDPGLLPNGATISPAGSPATPPQVFIPEDDESV